MCVRGWSTKGVNVKILFLSLALLMASNTWAVTWTYQVNINNEQGSTTVINSSKGTFDAGPHYCEITPVVIQNKTEFRTLVCSVGTGTVSTGALCTQKGAKVASVQYAILNLTGPKNLVNVVVACRF